LSAEGIPHQQGSLIWREYKAFMEILRHLQPSQQQLDQFQEGLVLCPAGCLTEEEIFRTFSRQAQTSIMTVSRAAAQRINAIVTQQLFAGKQALSDVPCAAVAGGALIQPYAGMSIVIDENHDKASRIVNGQDATLLSSHGKTPILRFPNQKSL